MMMMVMGERMEDNRGRGGGTEIRRRTEKDSRRKIGRDDDEDGDGDGNGGGMVTGGSYDTKRS